MEEVAHGVHKDHAGFCPAQGFSEFVRDQTEVEPLFVRVAGNSAKAFRECFCIAVFTTWTDFCAAAQWVPRSVCPFDFGRSCHREFLSCVDAEASIAYSATDAGGTVLPAEYVLFGKAEYDVNDRPAWAA